MRFLPRIKAALGRGDQHHHRRRADMTVEERLQPALQAQARSGLAEHGLDELRPLRDARPLQGVQARLGAPLPRGRATTASSGTPSSDIAHILRSCSANGTRFEFECYDIGHLYTGAHFLDRGLIKPPLFIQSVFGIRGGIGAHPEDVLHMKRTADRLFGDDYLWSVLGAGRNQMSRAMQSAVMGGNVRVGLEDSLWIGPGKLATANAEQVQKMRRILEELGLAVATPAQAREMLQLKGAGAVGF